MEFSELDHVSRFTFSERFRARVGSIHGVPAKIFSTGDTQGYQPDISERSCATIAISVNVSLGLMQYTPRSRGHVLGCSPQNYVSAQTREHSNLTCWSICEFICAAQSRTCIRPTVDASCGRYSAPAGLSVVTTRHHSVSRCPYFQAVCDQIFSTPYHVIESNWS